MDINEKPVFRAGESGSAMPLMIGLVLVLCLLLAVILTTAELARERVRQQAAADLTALAGANALAKEGETVRLIDFTIWSRNFTLDTLYVGATIVTIASAGSGAEAFAVPLKFQRATIGPVTKLEESKRFISQAAVVHSIAAGAAVAKRNGRADFGLAVPLPLERGLVEPQQVKDLKKLVEVYEKRMALARADYNQARGRREAKEAELRAEGLSEREIKEDQRMLELNHEVSVKAGRIGGLTTWKSKREKQLGAADKTGKAMVFAGSEGVLGVVYHPSSPVSFSGPIGGVETGNNLSVAAARVVEGPAHRIIGEEAVKKALSGSTVNAISGDALYLLLTAVNVTGGKARGLGERFGVVGEKLEEALDTLGVIPPSISELRPAIRTTDGLLSESSDLYGYIKKAGKLGKKFGVEGLEF